MKKPLEPSVSTGSSGAEVFPTPKGRWGSLTVTVIPSLESLESAAPAWDDLWGRSDRTTPFLRADRIAAWCRQFAPGAPFRAVAVADGDRLVAALPLVGGRRGPLRFAQAPNNHWSSAGDLIVDAAEKPDAWAPPLVSGLRHLPWSCAICRLCPFDNEAWGHLAAEAAGSGMLVLRKVADTHSFLRLENGAADAGMKRSRKHRKNLERALRQMEGAGGRAFKVYEPPPGEEVDRRMREGFAIEDMGWKGRNGTSVLRTHGMIDYFIDGAQRFAAQRNLMLFFLELGGKPIAFQFAFRGKDTVFLLKTTYDEAYARFSPGQVQAMEILQHLANRGIKEVVFGSASEATENWANSSRPLGTIVIARRNPGGRLAFALVRALLAWKERRRTARSTEPGAGGEGKRPPVPGAPPGSAAHGG